MADDPTAHHAVPLKSFQHLNTSNLGVLERGVGRFFPGAKFELNGREKPLHVIANRCQLDGIALAYSRLGAAAQIRIPDLDSYALLFSFAGCARARTGRGDVDIGANKALIGSPTGAVRLDYGADFEHLLLSVRPKALASKLEAMTGATMGEPLRFAEQADFRHPDTENLRQMFMLLVDGLDICAPDLRPLGLAELEQAIMVSFLTANDSNYSLVLRRPARSAASWQVRRVEAYIEANWDQPLTIEALALVTGVSARTLFHSFRKSRGYSPMDFAKRIRLGHARRMLEEGDASTAVTTVAYTCGFGNLGHFSGYYRRAFGELPSATLRRSLGAP